MHPRNPYRTPPDFVSLAESYSPLREHLIESAGGGVTINYKDEAAQRRLTEALMHRDFGLSLRIPEDRLCPPVPNRLNYVLWIQDILCATSDNSDDPVRGIDIGTGASAIYVLLACSLSPSWQLIGTDVDDISLRCALENVQRNGLSDRTHIMRASPDGPTLVPLAMDSTKSFDFVMCNPPFYSSAADVARSADTKTLGPNAVCTGADVEMITEGGESAFVCKMVRESVEFRERCRWYTSMLGKLSSLTEVVALLRSRSIDNYAITEFVQGQTRRWAIGWSFSDARLPDALARIPNPTLQSLMPPRTTLRQHLPRTPQLDLLRATLASIPHLRATPVPDAPPPTFLVSAPANTWSRAARRKRPSATPEAPMDVEAAGAAGAAEAKRESAGGERAPFMVCRACVAQDDEGAAVSFVWVRGRDRAAFEGFASHVGRKMRDATMAR
ncbi:hypothetical protein HETIRDRAFT_478853 [Heterobasidion irregulare TC 32-1]|uniref:U6 small nuclear RNA (adenine-(43)-N(6))-methyltransferase n=1 Tax=Heterobasidion irregulare (strain TC 32-1) TaxID=747525 RepID=W4JW56_HETIT|nr:uncharacterized protein HETIRDRAFT_478853 [Heterobasidion irregulare TC 32-1]ETW77709.1 hypothetical protein HETIRDRAFT_478853 [Heterobasidion irregulare TC 32-1]